MKHRRKERWLLWHRMAMIFFRLWRKLVKMIFFFLWNCKTSSFCIYNLKQLAFYKGLPRKNLEANLCLGFPDGASGRESVCQRRRSKTHGFNPWVGRISWKIPWTEETGGLQCMGSHRLGDNWSHLAQHATFVMSLKYRAQFARDFSLEQIRISSQG